MHTLKFTWSHTYMFLKGANQSLRIPKANLLGRILYRFCAKKLFGRVNTKTLDII